MCPLQIFNKISRIYGHLLRSWLFQFEGFAWHSRVTELNLVGVLLASLTFCGYIMCYSLSALDLAFWDYFVL